MNIIDAAMKYISTYNCSEQELRAYLEKTFSQLPELDKRIDSSLNRLKEFQLLNDLRLATNLAEHYSHKGNRFITNLLKQKGIKEDVINKVLGILDNEHVRAMAEARKKMAGLADYSERTMSLLHQFLSGRGFSLPTINLVISQFTKQHHRYFRNVNNMAA